MKKDDNKLTDRQTETFNFIIDYIFSKGFPPSVSEIAKGIYASKAVAQKHIEALTDKGYIKHVPRVARSITILKFI